MSDDVARLAALRELLVEVVSDFHDYIGQTVAGDNLVKRIRAALARQEKPYSDIQRERDENAVRGETDRSQQ